MHGFEFFLFLFRITTGLLLSWQNYNDFHFPSISWFLLFDEAKTSFHYSILMFQVLFTNLIARLKYKMYAIEFRKSINFFSKWFSIVHLWNSEDKNGKQNKSIWEIRKYKIWYLRFPMTYLLSVIQSFIIY